MSGISAPLPVSRSAYCGRRIASTGKLARVLQRLFIAVMPNERRRTPRSDAEELGILFCLMTVASPLGRQYYFMWLFFPITVLIHRTAYDPTWIALATAGILMCLSLPFFPNDLQAWGNNLAATAVLVGGLVWHILHPPGKAAAGIEDSPDDELALVHPTSISRLS